MLVSCRILVNLSVDVYLDGEQPAVDDFSDLVYPDVSSAPSAVVVGAGPCGLFAALRLIELGVRPIVVERGQDVMQRRRDLVQLEKSGVVDPESNYSFGEGGAGAFSDGKLYTRSKKRGSVEKVLRVFCRFGADPKILIDAHPHIGTDKLPIIIRRMRERIIASGGEVHFACRMEELILERGEVLGSVSRVVVPSTALCCWLRGTRHATSTATCIVRRSLSRPSPSLSACVSSTAVAHR